MLFLVICNITEILILGFLLFELFEEAREVRVRALH